MLFLLVGWDYVSELWLPTGFLFIHHLIHEYADPWRNDTDKGNPNNLEKKSVTGDEHENLVYPYLWDFGPPLWSSG
jgi:hypothetical protein